MITIWDCWSETRVWKHAVCVNCLYPPSCCCSASFFEVFPKEWHTTQLNQAWLRLAIISHFQNRSTSAWNELCAFCLYISFLNLKIFLLQNRKDPPQKCVEGDVINQLAIRYLGLACSNNSPLDLCLLCKSHWNLIKEYFKALILEIWLVFCVYDWVCFARKLTLRNHFIMAQS